MKVRWATVVNVIGKFRIHKVGKLSRITVYHRVNSEKVAYSRIYQKTTHIPIVELALIRCESRNLSYIHVFERTYIESFPSFDWGGFELAGWSQYPHIETFGLGNYRGNALTTGCSPNAPDFDDCSRRTEIFDMTDMTWRNFWNNPGVPDYPFAKTNEYVSV